MRIFKFILLICLFMGACEFAGEKPLEFDDFDEDSVLLEEKGYYLNDKYSFKVKLLDGFKIEELPSNEGILMVKWITPAPPTREQKIEMGKDWDERFNGYRVELKVSAVENYMDYEDLGDFIVDKFSDYNKEFYKEGVIVLQSAGGDSLKRYFVMNKDSSIIYEVTLKVKSYHYSEHEHYHETLIDSFSY